MSVEGSIPLDLKASCFADPFWMGLFDTHPDPLMLLNCDHRVVRMNAAQAKALGCLPEDGVGRFCFEIMHGSTCLVEECPHACMVRNHSEHSAEVMVDRMGGLFRVTVKPVFDTEGRLVGALHVAREIGADEGPASEPQGATAGDPLARGDSRARELRSRLRFNKLLLMIVQRLGQKIHAVDFLERVQHELARLAEAVGFERCVLLQGNAGALRRVSHFECVSAGLPPLPEAVTPVTVPFLFDGIEQSKFIRTTEEGVVRCAAVKSATSPDTSAVVLLVECHEQGLGCDSLYEDALRLMCEIVGGMILHAEDFADTQILRKKQIQADRVARLGQLTATLAHELNQPLAATLCNAQAAGHLLAQDPPDVKEARSALADIVESARQAGAIMRHTRALFKGVRLCRQPVDLNRVVKSVIELLQGDAVLAGTALTTFLDKALPHILGDETQLQQVVRNLLVNACDAVRDRPKRARMIVVRTELNGRGEVELCVQDSGVGIPAGMENKIFDLFYTTKPEGQGMGLPICRQIMQSHEGTIQAERVPEGGALFRITLPPFTAEAAGSR